MPLLQSSFSIQLKPEYEQAQIFFNNVEKDVKTLALKS